MKPYWIVNQIDNSTAEILLYGYIGSNDVTASDFVRELKALEKDNNKINIRINSAGGSVFDGFAIFNAIRQSKATIDTYVDGIAASMGSVIALAGKQVYMSSVARFMTHKPSGAVFGKASEMRQNADLLDGIEKSILSIYSFKTGLSADDAKNKYLTEDDKWFTAEEALSEKLVDGIYDTDQEKIDVPKNLKDEKAVWDCFNNRFQNKLNFNTDMKTYVLSAASIAALKITDSADATIVENAIATLAQQAAKVPGLEQQLQSITAEKVAIENNLDTLKKETTKKQVETLIQDAFKDKKVTNELAAVLKTQYADKPDALKDVLDKMPTYTGVTEMIDKGDHTNELTALVAKSYEVLDKEGKLERLKELSATEFQAKYKSKFGKEYPTK